MNRDGTMLSKEKKKISSILIVALCLYNWLENFLLFLLTLNSMFYSNIFSAIYFMIALTLTYNSLIKDEKKVRSKQIVTALGSVIGGIATLIKTIMLINLAIKKEIEVNEDELAIYKTFGIYLEKNRPVLGSMDIFMTIFFDLNEILLCILLTLMYQH
jgi:hypothetical protein